jgi:Flp pilus assembly protein TadD
MVRRCCLLEALTDIEPEEESHWYNLGYMYSKLMSAKSQDSIGNWQRACDAYAEAVRLKPDDPAGWNGWGVALDSWGKNLPDAEATAKFADADAKFAEAVRLRPYDHVVWCNWGHSLGRWATALPDAERPAKLAAADANYAEAVRLKPDDQEAWLYWGKTLAVWAQILPFG